MAENLTKRFDQALADVTALDERPDNATLLELYALYKQATEGDVSGDRPGFTNIVNRAKFDAWKKLASTPPDQAKQNYIDLVGKLKEA